MSENLQSLMMEDIIRCVYCLTPYEATRNKRKKNVELYRSILECSQNHLKIAITNSSGLNSKLVFDVPLCKQCFTASKKLYSFTNKLAEMEKQLRGLIATITREIKSRAFSNGCKSYSIQEQGLNDSLELIKEETNFVNDEDEHGYLDFENEIESNDEVVDISFSDEQHSLENYKDNYKNSKKIAVLHPSSSTVKSPFVLLERIDIGSKVKVRRKIKGQKGKSTVPSTKKKFEGTYLVKRYYEEKEEGKYECIACRKVFLNETRIKSHVYQVHLHKGKHVCEICGIAMNRKDRLAQHILAVHKNIRNYTCSTCGKGFGFPTGLKRHEETHKQDSERRKCKCDICGDKYFSKTSVLFAHQSQYHTVYTNNIITCHKCGNKFSDESEIVKHNNRLRNDSRLSCYICQELFVKFCDLLVHYELEHPTQKHHFQCDQCDLVFSSLALLNNHKTDNTCSYSFEKRESIAKGTYRCDICLTHFSQLQSLERHVKMSSTCKPKLKFIE